MTRQEIQFGDEEGAYVESFGNGIGKKNSTLKENNEIDYLGHIKAGIEVLSKKEDLTESISLRAMQIITDYNLENVEIDNVGIGYFQNKTKEKILNMIEIVLINYQHNIKK